MLEQLPVSRVWVIDFEFRVIDGEQQQPEDVHCLCAWELKSGRRIALWRDELKYGHPPFDVGSDSLCVAFSAAAEASCFLALGWPLPARVLDLYPEFKNLTNDEARHSNRRGPASLVAAMRHFGLKHRLAEEKQEFRELAIRGGPFTSEEQRGLLDYCMEDVDATGELLRAMLPKLLERGGVARELNLLHCLFRGRYMGEVAVIERHGIPVNRELLLTLQDNWNAMRRALVQRFVQLGIYNGISFTYQGFIDYLKPHAAVMASWPRLESGKLALDKDTVKYMANRFPAVAGPIHEQRATLAELKINKLHVDADGRHRYPLMPFGSLTSRNQPSTSRSIFGAARWLRHLITAPEDSVLVYLDYSAQEIGIAAGLSRDEAMMADYQDDPYIGFARRIGLVPPGATKATHPAVRETVKVLYLGINYGMGAENLAYMIGRPRYEAESWLDGHHQSYARFWRWSDGAVEYCQTLGLLTTPLGWQLIGPLENPRTARNFMLQATGAEMLRIAIGLLLEAGIAVCAPVHDALLIEVPLTRAAERIAQAAHLMEQASRLVLKGFTCRVGGAARDNWIMPGEHYSDPRAAGMWNLVLQLLREAQSVSAETRICGQYGHTSSPMA